MPLIAETQLDLVSNLVKTEYPFKNLSRSTVELIVSKGDKLEIGNVVGKVEATGVIKIAKADAADGSEAFAGAIVSLPEGATSPFVATKSAVVKVVILDEAPAMLNPDALVLDASYGADEKVALLKTIEAKGIRLASVAK